MDILTLPTQPRPDLGKRATARLREKGLIPAIVYGHKQDPVAVALARDEFDSALRHHARLVELKHSSGTETALIKDVQHDHLGRSVLHVDFERVDRNERVEIEVPLELKGAPASAGGVLDQPLHVLSISCLAGDVPEAIKVNLTTLHLGEAIHVKELVLPTGVQALDDPDAVVVALKAPEVKVETPAAPTEEGSAEPEIVGRRVKTEEAAE